MSRFLADSNGLRGDPTRFLSYVQGCTLRKQMFSNSPEGSVESGRVEQLVPTSPRHQPGPLLVLHVYTRLVLVL